MGKNSWARADEQGVSTHRSQGRRSWASAEEEKATELLKAGGIVWRDPDVGVEIEAFELGRTRGRGSSIAGGEPLAPLRS